MVLNGWVGENIWGLVGLGALVCVWVFFCCYSGGCLYQGYQGAGGVDHWYNRPVSRRRKCRREVQCGESCERIEGGD
jgi:hypothetical protein